MLERKGLQFVIEALRGFPAPFELHVVGEGPYLQALKDQAQAAGVAVTFWGWLDHHASRLKDLYETSSIYVLPSEMENFPMVLLEAMVAQTAIITTRGTGCAEVVGDAAWLVPAKDPAAIREALLGLIRDPSRAKALAAAGRRRLEEHFGWPAVAQRYLALYTGIARTEQGA
jgi:glycosyltransferase involved in cell wall biosynthesis